MMKSWADHCSSDDEEDLAERTRAVLQVHDDEVLDDSKNGAPTTSGDAVPRGDEPAGSDDYQHRPKEDVTTPDARPAEGGGGRGRQYQGDTNDSGPMRDSFRGGRGGRGGGGGGERHGGRQQGGRNAATGPREYTFPAEPPFTAFVGNLSFQMQENDDLANELVNIAKEVLGLDLVVTECRIMRQRGTPERHRGFAYVKVETLDMLKGLMELNVKPVELLGRTLQLDTAQPHSHGDGHSNNHGGGRRGSSQYDGNHTPDIDGTQFRGGRYNNSHRDSHNNRGSAASSRRGEGGAPHASTPTGEAGADAAASSSGPPPQRQSLKLQPRTRVGDAAEGASPAADLSSSASNIFGGGKARDESQWKSRRTQQGDDKPAASSSTPPSSSSSGGAGAATAGDDRRQSHSHPRSSDSKGRGFGGRGGRGFGNDSDGPDGKRRSGRGGGEVGEAVRGFDGHRRQQQPGRGSGTGGRGGGGAGATASGDHNHHKTHKERKERTASAKGASSAAAPSPQGTPAAGAPAVEAEVKKPLNKFAALAMDDSDSD